ncbi:hypothetical protein TWF718_008198 [Orbilia javanica]|uniref:F-box domain-containing protein n=1 Tax=Orbilia javanica TaxID=47235 RepID=A0AAN8N4P1_9PEZI
MSNSIKRRPNLENLPIDLKIEIFESLDSIYDLDALSATCTTFHNILKTPKNISNIYLNLLSRGDLGDLLRVLSAVRAYGRDGRIQTLEDESLPTPNRTGYLQELLGYRSTARWFSNQLFTSIGRKLARFLPNSSTEAFIPSRKEKERIDEMFLMIWIFAETSYVSLLRRSRGTSGAEKYGDSLDDLYSRVMSGYTLAVSADVGVMYSAGMFLSGMLTPAVLRYVGTLSQEEIIAIGDEVGCLDSYHKIGVPDVILLKYGLNGYQEILTKDDDEQDRIIQECYSSVIQSRSWNTVGYIYGYYTPSFVKLIDCIWEGSNDGSQDAIYARPLWKNPGSTSKAGVPPWDQGEGFDIDVIFCDDYRLEKLGYFPPGMIEGSSRGFRQTDALEDRIQVEPCNCEDGWWCPRKYEIWKNEAGPVEVDEDAPGWGVHLKRRAEKLEDRILANWARMADMAPSTE